MDTLLVAVSGPAGSDLDAVVSAFAACEAVHVTVLPPPRTLADGALIARFDAAALLPPPEDEARWLAAVAGPGMRPLLWITSNPGAVIATTASPWVARPGPGMAADVSRFVSAQRELAAARRRAGRRLDPELMLSILDRVFEGILVAAPPGESGSPILYVNRAFEQQSGLASADVIGRDARRLGGSGSPFAALASQSSGSGDALVAKAAPVVGGTVVYGTGAGRCEAEWKLLPIVADGRLVAWAGMQQDVSYSARRAAQAERSEARFRSLVDRQVGLVCRCLADGRVTFLNESAARALRGAGSGQIGSRLDDAFTEEGAQQLRLALASPLADEFSMTLQRRPELGGGWFSWRLVMVDTDASLGLPREWQGFGEDVTDRRVADQRRTMLAEALDRASDAVGLFDLDGEVRYANRTLRKWLGARLVEPGLGWSVLFRGDDLRARILADLAGPGRSHVEEMVLETLGGGPRSVLIRLSRLGDPGDSFLAVMTDVTARRAAEEDVRRLAAFPLFHPEPVLELQGGRCTFSNEAAQRVVRELGLRSPTDLLPMGWERLAEGALEQGRRAPAGEVSLGERTYGWMFNPLRRSGVVHAFAENLTDRRRLEGALSWMNRVESMRVLSGGVAHEFNNVLAIIGASAEVMELGDVADQGACIQAIHDAVGRGNRIVEQLSDLSRPVRPQKRSVNLAEILRAHVNAMRPLLPDVIRLVLDVDVPPGGAWVHGDAGQIGQMLVNLTTNARDAMPQGGRLTFALEPARPADLLDAAERYGDGSVGAGAWWCIRVADTGIGIPAANQQSIFDPFYTTKAPGKGTGLGLAVVLNQLRAHGGLVDLQSEEGLGCTITLFFPASGESAVAFPTTVAAEEGDGSRVLVVENEPFLRLRLETLLARSGFDVRSAEDAERAAAECATFVPQVILVDHGLPGSTGTRLIQDCRAAGWKGGAVVMTGSQDPAVRDEVEALGDVAFLHKPFHLHDLVGELRAALPRC